MSKRGRGVLLADSHGPTLSGYLVIGNDHYEIKGQRMTAIRTNLDVRHLGEIENQGDLFEPRGEGDRERSLP
jgi:hypothetical protein